MKERAVITQELCTHVKILLAGGASGQQAAKITNTSSGTISRIKMAGFDYATYMANTEKRRITEKNKKADAAIAQAISNLRQEEKQEPEQMRVELVYDPSIAEEYRREQEQKNDMNEQTKMMRFQAAQVDKIVKKLDEIIALLGK